MRTRKHTFIPAEGWETGALEAWLEDEAVKGWRLADSGSRLAAFDRAEPACCRVRLQPKQQETAEAWQERADAYGAMGWAYAGELRGQEVYYCEDPTAAELELKAVAEGGLIPETEIKTKEHLVSLSKRGRMLVASYEAIRFQKLDLFSVMLRQIGSYIQKQQLADAVQVLTNGDGNENAAAVYTVGTSPISGTQGNLTYNQLVEFWGQFDPYTMNTMLCSTATMTKLLKIAELQNPLTGLNFQGTGKPGSPLGAQLHRTSAVADGVIIGLDNRYALEMVRAGDVLVEYDKLIDRQLERAAITSISGFGKICDGAAKVLNV